MRHTDLVNAIEALVDATCADSVKDALAAVCAARAADLVNHDASARLAWSNLAVKLNDIENYGV